MLAFVGLAGIGVASLIGFSAYWIPIEAGDTSETYTFNSTSPKLDGPAYEEKYDYGEVKTPALLIENNTEAREDVSETRLTDDEVKILEDNNWNAEDCVEGVDVCGYSNVEVIIPPTFPSSIEITGEGADECRAPIEGAFFDLYIGAPYYHAFVSEYTEEIHCYAGNTGTDPDFGAASTDIRLPGMILIPWITYSNQSEHYDQSRIAGTITHESVHLKQYGECDWDEESCGESRQSYNWETQAYIAGGQAHCFILFGEDDGRCYGDYDHELYIGPVFEDGPPERETIRID